MFTQILVINNTTYNIDNTIIYD